MTNCCKVCRSAANLKCSKCYQVFYCDRKCQISDWKAGHRNECKPFEVMRNEKLGRFMVAARDLNAGEVLFREFAVVHGPKMKSHPICLGCHTTLQSVNSHRCSKCSWPVCGKKCESLDPHAIECQLMSSKNYKCPIAYSKCSKIQSDAVYCLIFPLRFLLMKRNQPKIFEKILSELESHVEERIASGSYEGLKQFLVPFVHKLLDKKEFPEDLILTCAAILDNNCFEISKPLQNIEMGGLFLLSLILCHDCVPNTKHYVNFIDSDVDIQRYQMTFQTTVPVKKGEHLTTTYTNTLRPTLERRKHLKRTKIFDCDCKRCSDPTELLTHGSAWICSSCGGLIESKNPLDNESMWECSKCRASISPEEISLKFNRFQQNIGNLIKNPQKLENFILLQSKIVYENNLLIIELKYMLCLMYGNVSGFHYDDLSNEQLKRKIDVCQDVIRIYDKVDPGQTSQRTNVLFELHSARIIEQKRLAHYKDSQSREKVLVNVEEHLKVIKECYEILIVETENKRIMDSRLDKILNEIAHV